MPKLVDISIRIPRGTYEELEKRARIVGVNVQTYIRTLLERHVSRAREKIGDFESREVDLILRLQHIIRRIKSIESNGFQNLVISRVCFEDISHIVKDLMAQIKQAVVEKCGGKLTDECKDYEEFRKIEIEVSKVQDPITKLRTITSRYYRVVAPFIKQLFFMERCGLLELTFVLYNALSNPLAKLVTILLDLD